MIKPEDVPDELVITVVIRNADRDLLDRANAALLTAGFDGFFSELQTTAQYEADTRPSLTIVPPGAHRRTQTSPVTINITGPSRRAADDAFAQGYAQGLRRGRGGA